MYSIVLPVYNEKDNLKILIPEIFGIINFVKVEVIIIDDDSDDGTEIFVNTELSKYEHLVYVNRKNENRSLGISVGEGINISKFDNIILMDCDLSHGLEDVVNLIKLHQNKNYDLICCSRFLDKRPNGFFLRYHLSKIYNYILKPFLSLPVLDNLSGFFLVKKKLLNDLKFDKIFYGYGDYYFRLLYYLNKKKISIIEMGFVWKDRKYGKSKTKFMKIFYNYTLEAIKLRIKTLYEK